MILSSIKLLCFLVGLVFLAACGSGAQLSFDRGGDDDSGGGDIGELLETSIVSIGSEVTLISSAGHRGYVTAPEAGFSGQLTASQHTLVDPVQEVAGAIVDESL